jgi:Zn-dependent protease with chaperone function
MNFYQHQDRARQNTQRLALLFILSLGVVTIAVYGAVKAALGVTAHMYRVTELPCSPLQGTSSRFLRRSCYYSDPRSLTNDLSLECRVLQRKRAITIDPYEAPQDPEVIESCKPVQQQLGWWDASLFFWVVFCTTTVVGFGSFYKTSLLRAGGSAIAAEMGGRLVLPESATPTEQQLLNVVEEMAIAAGIKIPSVYVLTQEAGINAFAAGRSIEDAAIGITQGALDAFTRDELQGVIGHEFSHILNGDMRLNIRMSGVIYGLVMVYVVGRVCLAIRCNNSRINTLFIFFGLALMAIGSVGVLCSRLIQAAISRQREFLADASAVQFTRNPEGIASALYKIAQHYSGAIVYSPLAEANSHMFFGDALRFSAQSLFATHPTLDERIQRIKGLVGEIRHTNQNLILVNSAANSRAMGFAGAAVTDGKIALTVSLPLPNWVGRLPQSIQDALDDPQAAIAVVYALCLDSQNAEIQAQQLIYLQQELSEEFAERVSTFGLLLDSVDTQLHLPLLDQLSSVLQLAEAEQTQQWLMQLSHLAQVEGGSLTGFAVYMILQMRLQPIQTVTETHNSIEPIWTNCLVLLSTLAQVGHTHPDNAVYAFRTGAFRLLGAGQKILPNALLESDLRTLQRSLEQVALATQTLKQLVVNACAETVMLDSVVTPQEALLLGIIARRLSCPVPAFLQPNRQ